MERRNGEFQSEIEKLSLVNQTLRRKGKEDSDRFAEVEQRRGKEIASMNKKIQELERVNRQQTRANEALRIRLDKRNEPIAVSNRLKRGSKKADDSLDLNDILLRIVC